MNACMAADKPRIAILMAVYAPRMDWLREQLLSLNAQTYPNLVLYVRDDGSSAAVYGQICALVRACVTAFPFFMARNEANLGSNRTFERLTQEAEGDYFAYCDQDDVWLPEKLSVLQRAITAQNALLACSDMFIIDGAGKQTADSITKARKRHVFCSGEGLAEGLVYRNFVTGCAMLIRAESAKAALPYCPYMVHDHYLALWCAAHGRIVSVPQPLIRYRIHGSNQTGLMAGVRDRESYRERRIDAVLDKLSWLSAHADAVGLDPACLHEGLLWARARHDRFTGGKRTARTVWKYRRFGPLTALFELIAVYLPRPLFQAAIALSRRNIL